MIKYITFFGSSEVKPGSPDYDGAFQVAKLLGQHGYIIVNGGGPGVMKAASEGVRTAGGKAVAMTFNPKDMTHFEGRDPTNLVDEIYVYETYAERTMRLLERGDVYVFFNGGTGTISEMGMAWGLAKLYFGHHKPLIFYGTFWHEILEAFGKNMLIRPEEIRVYRIVTTPQEVLDEIKSL
jgi:hypothetical protein